MDRFKILKNPDLKPYHAYALTPEEQRKIKEEKEFKKRQARRTLSDIERESIISQHLQSTTGRAQIAASMSNLLRQRMDLGSLARRIFSVQPLPDGTLPIYSRIANNPAYVIDEEGQEIQTLARGNNIAIPLFEIGSNPQIPLASIRERHNDLINRTQDQVYYDLRRAEESRAFNLLRAASNGNTNLVAAQFNSEISITNTLQQAFDTMEGPGHEQRVVNIFLNAVDYSNVRQHLQRNHLDETTHREIRSRGLFASLWGAQIFVSHNVSPGEIYLIPEPNYVGIFPIRTDITVLSADNPVLMTVGWSIFENIGMGCFNPRSVLRVTVPTINHMTRTVETIRRIGFGDEIFDLIPDNVTEIPEDFRN